MKSMKVPDIGAVIKNLHYPKGIDNLETCLEQLKFQSRKVMAENIMKGQEDIWKADISDEIRPFRSLILQYHTGVQLQVRQEVSDELDNVNILKVLPDCIPMIGECHEIYFEDSKIPTCIFHMSSSFNDWIKQYEVVDVNNPLVKKRCESAIGVFLILWQNNDQEYVYDFIDLKDYQNIISGKEPSDHKCDDSITDSERAMSNYLLGMAIKLMLYCSLPQYRPIQIHRKGMTKGGKPGVRNRPRRPAFRTIFLPPVLYKHDKKREHTETGKTVEPHNRRGHLRMLTSDRFTNKKGEIVYVRPSKIHGGNEEKIVHYIARKPK